MVVEQPRDQDLANWCLKQKQITEEAETLEQKKKSMMENILLQEQKNKNSIEEAKLEKEKEEAKLQQKIEQAKLQSEIEEAKLQQKMEEAKLSKEMEEANLEKKASRQSLLSKENEEIKIQSAHDFQFENPDVQSQHEASQEQIVSNQVIPRVQIIGIFAEKKRNSGYIDKQPESESDLAQISASAQAIPTVHQIYEQEEEKHQETQFGEIFQEQLYTYLTNKVKKQIPRSSKKSQKQIIKALYGEYKQQLQEQIAKKISDKNQESKQKKLEFQQMGNLLEQEKGVEPQIDNVYDSDPIRSDSNYYAQQNKNKQRIPNMMSQENLQEPLISSEDQNALQEMLDLPYTRKNNSQKFPNDPQQPLIDGNQIFDRKRLHIDSLKQQIFRAISSGHFGMSQSNKINARRNINLSTFGQLGKEGSCDDLDIQNKFDTINKTLARIESKIDKKDRISLYDSLTKLDAEISNLQKGSSNSQQLAEQPSPNEVDQIIQLALNEIDFMPYSLAIEIVYMFILSKNISVLPVFHSQIKQKIVNYSRLMNRSKSNEGLIGEMDKERLDTFFNNSFGPEALSFGALCEDLNEPGEAKKLSKNEGSIDDKRS